MMPANQEPSRYDPCAFQPVEDDHRALKYLHIPRETRKCFSSALPLYVVFNLGFSIQDFNSNRAKEAESSEIFLNIFKHF